MTIVAGADHNFTTTHMSDTLLELMVAALEPRREASTQDALAGDARVRREMQQVASA